MESFQTCDSHFGMFVSKGCEKTARHVLSKMKKLITSVLAKFDHCITTFNNNLPIRVHAKSTDYIYKDINISS